MNPNIKKEFEEQFGARVEPGHRTFRRPIAVPNWSAYNIGDMNMSTEIIPSLTIHISEEEFEHMTQYMPGRIIRERNMREDIPALKKAWDNYQLLLKLCSGDYY